MNLLDALRDCYLFKSTVMETLDSNFFELTTFLELDVPKTLALIERIHFDFRHASWHRHTLDGSSVEPASTYLLDTFWNYEIPLLPQIPDIHVSDGGFRQGTHLRRIWDSGESKVYIAAVLDVDCLKA